MNCFIVCVHVASSEKLGKYWTSVVELCRELLDLRFSGLLNSARAVIQCAENETYLCLLIAVVDTERAYFNLLEYYSSFLV